MAFDPPQGTWPNNSTAARTRLGLDIDFKIDAGASGSNQNTTGSIPAGSNSLALTVPIDFKNNQGISIIGAGGGPFETDGVTPLSAPASLTVTPTGGSGSTTYRYWCAALDNNFGVTAARSGVTNAGTSGALSPTNYITNTLTVPAVTGAAGYVWWGDPINPVASTGLLGITAGHSFSDIGMGSVIGQVPPGPSSSSGLYYLPVTPPSAAVGDVLRSIIVGGAGTTRLVLANYAVTSVTGAYVGHNDNQAFINAATDAIAQGRQLKIPAGDYVIDELIYTDVSKGASLISLYMYGEGNNFSGNILDFYAVLGIGWEIDNPSAENINGLTLLGLNISLWSRNGPFTINCSGWNPSLLNAHYNSNISILVNNVGPVASLNYMFESKNITIYAVYISEQDSLSAIPLQINAVEYSVIAPIVYSNLGYAGQVFIALGSETGGNTFLNMICDGAISFADDTTAYNTFISPIIGAMYAAQVNPGLQNMMVNPVILSIDTAPNPAALTIIGGPYDNYGSGGGEGGLVTNQLLTTTNPTNILTVTVPGYNKAYKANLTFDVITAPTTVQAQVACTNPNTGAQTWVWESGASALAVDSHMEVQLLILAAAGSTITITLTAGTANQVLATASIEPQ